MHSGNPEPADELSLILNIKRNQPNQALEVVSEASRWLKSQLSGVDCQFDYTACEPGNPSAFATFSVLKECNGVRLVLDMKVAEVHGKPYVFAEILQIGSMQGRLFPFFADISSHASKQHLLHYIADFLLV